MTTKAIRLGLSYTSLCIPYIIVAVGEQNSRSVVSLL